MLSKGGRMAAELVNVATSEKLKEMDWTKNIEICELVVCDPGQGKHVIKSVKKRLQHKHPNTQLFAVMLLEMLLNNCGEHIHKQVIDHGLLPIMVKIVKKKTELPVRERIFLLLDATQTALGGASGKFPQYYAAYYDLVSAKVQFPQRPNAIATNAPAQNPQTYNVPDHDSIPPKLNTAIQQSTTPSAPDSSIIQKARSVLEVLQEVLNALDPQNPKGASDEFTLDLVEQCSFQKQRVMHLVMTSRDEKVVSQAIELNDQLHNVLTKHDALLSVHSSPDATFINHQEEPNEEENLDRLLHRLRKGKACAEVDTESSPNMFRSNQWDHLQRPRTRSLCIEPTSQNVPNGGPRIPTASMSNGSSALIPGIVSIPPPPAKHIEREKFFKENKDVTSGLARHMRGLSLDSRNGSSSYSGSTDLSDRDTLGFRD